MSISDKDMAHLKTLARLELSEAETLSLKTDLNKILGYFEQIRHLDTEGVEELVRPINLENVFREDVIGTPLTHEDAMQLAVEHEDAFFKVPRTVDSSDA